MMSPARIELKHVSRFRDRHGHMRHYLRIPGRKPVALPGAAGSPEFMAAYAAAIDAAAREAPKPSPAPAATPGTLDALAIAYYRHQSFTGLRASSQANYRRIVEALRAKHGTKPVRMLDATAIRLLMAEKGEQRAAANHRLRVLRALCAVAIEAGQIAADPTSGVKRLRHETTGYTSWSEDEIALYEKHWPSGTRERLAFALLLYTAQRRSDVVRMGRQHMRGAFIAVRQIKNPGRDRGAHPRGPGGRTGPRPGRADAVPPDGARRGLHRQRLLHALPGMVSRCRRAGWAVTTRLAKGLRPPPGRSRGHDAPDRRRHGAQNAGGNRGLYSRR